MHEESRTVHDDRRTVMVTDTMQEINFWKVSVCFSQDLSIPLERRFGNTPTRDER